MKSILFFVDGVGIGERNNNNPLYKYKNLSLGYFKDQFYTVSEGCKSILKVSDNKVVFSVDPVMGVEGIPQSATGQTSIFSGVNAQKLAGKHLSGFPNRFLRKILNKDNILLFFKNKGLNVSFINVFNKYSSILSSSNIYLNEDGTFYPESFNKYTKMISVTTTLGIILKQRFYDLNDLKNERSIYQDFSNRSLKQKIGSIPFFSPQKAANILFNLLDIHDIILYEYFQTDITGHKKNNNEKIISEELDNFIKTLENLILNANEEINLFIFSDHGNFEDLSVKTHTFNNIPFIHFSNNKIEINKVPAKISDIYDYITSFVYNFNVKQK